MAQLTLKNRKIGKGQPVFIIAEAGVNHNGDISLAHQLVDAAVDAGADAVKFQTFITEENIALRAPLAGHHLANVGKKLSHFELIKRLELPFNRFVELKSHCEEKGVVFLSTPYDLPSTQFLIELGCEAIKIASSEMTNYPLLDVVRRSKIPVILSTGMSHWEEIVDSVNFLGEYHFNICILKCTSNYPASPESINLCGIIKLKETFPQCVVGFSDHSIGDEISLASLGFEVCIIERHFTLDKSAWGPDHKASMTTDELKHFVLAIRKAEEALGTEDWDIQTEEVSQSKTMQKGVYARTNIKQGERITLADVKFLRPPGEITPKFFFLYYMNRITTAEVLQGEKLTTDIFNRICSSGSGF